jgi:NADH-quinone oxidoreductase subunit A
MMNAALVVGEAGTYLPVAIFLVGAIGFAVSNVVVAKMLGPSRHGAVKDMPYESGMNPIGSARKRFNVRFYLIAMVFLLFDIEVLFLIPWAVVFRNLDFSVAEGGVWLGRILFFVFTTVVAYVYGYKKGVFRFD